MVKQKISINQSALKEAAFFAMPLTAPTATANSTRPILGIKEGQLVTFRDPFVSGIMVVSLS